MRNLLGDKEAVNLGGHASFVRCFVQDEDLSGKDVLDVGCGFAWFCKLALTRGARSVVGIEPEEASLDVARRSVLDQRCSFRVASATHLPFADESFDVVSLWEVLEHLPKGTEAQAFTEIARILRPGGALYLSTPNAHPIATSTDPAWWLAGHRHYVLEDVERLARDAGLAVEVSGRKAGLPQIAFMLNLYVAKWVFRREPFFNEKALRSVNDDWTRERGFAHVVLRARRLARPE